MVKRKPKVEEPPVETTQGFALAVGQVCGAIGREDIKLYLKNRGIKTSQITALYKAAITVANAFYVERK